MERMWRVFGAILFVVIVAVIGGCVGLLLLDALLIH